MAALEVSGLSAAKFNFQKLKVDAQKEIGREALREAGWSLADKMRAATYHTFVRRTGAIRSGLSVAVGKSTDNLVLPAWVVEYPQSVAGTAPAAVLFRKHFKLKSRTKHGEGRSIAIGQTAYWWRFLEFGTGPRGSQKTPSVLRSSKATKSARVRLRQATSVGHWLQSTSHGAIKARPWIRPVFAGAGQASVESFRATFLKLIDAAVSAMPRK